jgi:FkbM family methyltransferase
MALLNWQISQRIKNDPRNIEFLEGLKMNVNIGEKGVTGNIYVGVHDFKEIFFSLHLMRREDVFVDLGSNVGFYCLSVSHIVGSNSFAFEPIKQTFDRLLYNIKLNQLEQRVIAINNAVGSSNGKIKMTADLDTVNHVTLENDSSFNTEFVEVVSLDKFFSNNNMPLLIKIDVEGYEIEVLNGMDHMLLNNDFKALIIEINGSGGRYAQSDESIHEKIISHGFNPYDYDPFTRKLTQLNTYSAHNTIYIRNVDFVEQRLSSSRAYRVFNELV